MNGETRGGLGVLAFWLAVLVIVVIVATAVRQSRAGPINDFERHRFEMQNPSYRSPPRESGAMPYLKNGQCGGSYSESGGFCNPKGPDSAPTIPKPPGVQCPSGWASGAHSCEKMR